MALVRGHFERSETKMPSPGPGEVVVKAEYFSPDAMNHAWVRGMPGKFDPLAPGTVMRGGVAGAIVKSANPQWPEGTRITGFLDWADYSLSDGTDYMGVPLQIIPEGIDTHSGLVTLGMSGVCAWLGLFHFCHARPGDDILISGASGAIGSIAGQLAPLAGCRPVGIAGGPEKCSAALDAGFDAMVDYKAPDLGDQIAAACPDGVNIFFDNVGGALLDAALVSMAHNGQVLICGGTAHYGAVPTPIYNHIHMAMRSLTMRGFFYFDHVDMWGEARERLTQSLKEGAIREWLDIAEGFDATPDAALAGFSGGVNGRKLVWLD
ncbi:NADP-dependent oxidoreductase [Croceicoccus ponticola]|uniref:NADP-dependent oxidoreductase n=2 Tax=Croceicoccus ponticola TaxID=2217664 RepID=A0A437GUN5_9SPHN|nr:NADP-dependent oxidoreductase [Croceicoccus ponticola]